jgi:hypothetical protein
MAGIAHIEQAGPVTGNIDSIAVDGTGNFALLQWAMAHVQGISLPLIVG